MFLLKTTQRTGVKKLYPLPPDVFTVCMKSGKTIHTRCSGGLDVDAAAAMTNVRVESCDTHKKSFLCVLVQTMLLNKLPSL